MSLKAYPWAAPCCSDTAPLAVVPCVCWSPLPPEKNAVIHHKARLINTWLSLEVCYASDWFAWLFTASSICSGVITTPTPQTFSNSAWLMGSWGWFFTNSRAARTRQEQVSCLWVYNYANIKVSQRSVCNTLSGPKTYQVIKCSLSPREHTRLVARFANVGSLSTSGIVIGHHFNLWWPCLFIISMFCKNLLVWLIKMWKTEVGIPNVIFLYDDNVIVITS